ncbi:chemotaxis protein CheW [Kovacikia minuta CCNUW1]|uniref:chemotaxis protein CheW n=1 Tax=Kovacikia minuta TaxID=2931930 RepID=UPI001CD020F3|nr:chemotaxis protein CheW [Kovacikia minuta]UBF27939.1 chemotaxis protein CheW [Kovacikia minuta CCNUW1]
MTQRSSFGDHQSQNHARLLQLAYQGDVTAIATLMNRHLLRQQITCQVAWEGNGLQIRLEAARVPAPEPLFSVIHRTILKLQVHTLKTLKVSCYQAGSDQVAWSQERAIVPTSAVKAEVGRRQANRVQPATAAPISLQDWLRQKAQASLVELIQPTPTASEPEAELRFLRFSFSAAETALLPLSSIRQVMKLQPQTVMAVPDLPAFVIGVGNFHGEMLWMVDLGLQLGFQGTPAGWDNLRQSTPTGASLAPGNWMAIVVQAQGKSLGLVVPQVIDIESHTPNQLQPPTVDLFPPTLLPFIQGYLVRSSSPVLDVNTLIADRRLQVHAA